MDIIVIIYYASADALMMSWEHCNEKVVQTLREMCPNTEFFLVRIFPHSDWIRRDTSHLSVFSPNAEKYGLEKSPYLDTFNPVHVPRSFQIFPTKSYNQIVWSKVKCIDSYWLSVLCWLLLRFIHGSCKKIMVDENRIPNYIYEDNMA